MDTKSYMNAHCAMYIKMLMLEQKLLFIKHNLRIQTIYYM